MKNTDMPHNLPKPKEVTFDVAGKHITVGASVLSAGDAHSWARSDRPVVVLKPLGDTLGENNEARELLGGRDHADEVRVQAIEKLRDELGAKGVDKTEIVMLGPSTIRKKDGGIRYA